MKKISERVLFQGKWISLYEAIYENKHGEKVLWESVKRNNSPVGMVVVAQLMPTRRFILIKQYRPAVDAYVLGFPAGLADGDPQHALVELKEETGYTGKIITTSPVLKNSSGLINDSGQVVVVQVDEEDPLNQNPQQELEATEDIEVHLVDRQSTCDFILQEHANGTHIGSNLWYLFGLQGILAD